MEHKGQTTEAGQSKEVRCPRCSYFICEPIFGHGESGLKFICKRCKVRLLVRISESSFTVGQI